jgi:hypothetical protein
MSPTGSDPIGSHALPPDPASSESSSLLGSEQQRNRHEETRIVAESDRREAERFRALTEEAR